MLKVGITGEMGSGKTFIANLFKTEKKVPVYNCDQAAKILMVTNEKLIEDVKKHFGENIYEGHVFKNLSNIVFAKDEQSVANLKILSDLIHPYIYEDIEEFCKKNKTALFVLIESAILYENKMEKNLNLVIYVSVPLEIRKKRALERDKITSEDYDNRMKTQISTDIKTSKCNYIIFNNGFNNMKDRVNSVYNSIEWSYIHASSVCL